jgi:hypothetical protein
VHASAFAIDGRLIEVEERERCKTIVGRIVENPLQGASGDGAPAEAGDDGAQYGLIAVHGNRNIG